MENEGFLYLARLDHDGNILKSERRRYIVVNATSHTLSYYSDSEKNDQCGIIDLRYALVDYDPDVGKDVFIVRDIKNVDNVFRLSDPKNPVNISTWCTMIDRIIHSVPSPIEYAITPEDIKGGYVCSMIIKSFRKDEITQNVEFEIYCHAMFLSRKTTQKIQTRWSAWRTYEDFKLLDSKLRVTCWQMEKIEFPRERKRDTLLGGNKSKTVQETRMNSLSEYLQHILGIPSITEFYKHHGNLDLKAFVDFDTGFGEDVPCMTKPLVEQFVKAKEKVSSNVQKQARSAASTLRARSRTKFGLVTGILEQINNGTTAKDDSTTNENLPTQLSTPRSSDIELVKGEEASALNNLIIEAVVSHAGSTTSLVDSFKAQTKAFGEGRLEADKYFQFLLNSFGKEFAIWLGNDLLHLVPDESRRRALYRVLQSEKCHESLEKDKSVSSIEEENVSSLAFDEVVFVTDPVIAQEIHQKILNRVFEIFGKNIERVEDFQDQTKSFGQGELSASEYIAYLHGAIGPDESRNLIRDMVRLLPDEAKRQSLIESQKKALDRIGRRKNNRSKQFSKSEDLLPPPPLPIRIDVEQTKGELLNQAHGAVKRDPKISLSTTNIPAQKSSSNKSRASSYHGIEKEVELDLCNDAERKLHIISGEKISSQDYQNVENEKDTNITNEYEEEVSKNEMKNKEDEQNVDSQQEEINPVLARLRKQGAINLGGLPSGRL